MNDKQRAWSALFRKAETHVGLYPEEKALLLDRHNKLLVEPFSDEVMIKLIDLADMYGWNWQIDWDEVGDIESTHNPLLASFVSYGKFLEEDRKRPPSFLDNFILKGSYTFIHAGSGVGKTPFMMMMCKAMLNGTKFLSWLPGEVKPKKILLMDGELNGWLLQERLLSCFENNHLDDIDVFSMMDHVEAGHQPIDLMIEAHRKIMLDALVEHKPDVVVMDNRQDFFSGKESDNDEARILNEWIKIIRHKGIAFISCHHDAKGGSFRGASSMVSPVDTRIHLTKEKETENCINAVIEKPRFGMPLSGLRSCQYEININIHGRTSLDLL